MRSTMCSFGRRKLKRSSSKQDLDEVGLRASIVDFMKPRCLFRAKKQRKLMQHNQESTITSSSISQLITLQDWLLASPCFNSCGGTKLSHHSQRVYPSLIDHVEAEGLLVSGVGGESMCLDGEEFEDCSSSLTRRSQSGRKTRKRVSFRLPGPDDVILI